MKRFSRGLIIAAVSVPLVAGCSLMSPQRTSQTYTPADGWNATVSKGVEMRNVLIVANEDNTQGAVVGLAVNNTKNEVKIELAAESVKEVVTVPAGESVHISPKADVNMTFPKLPAMPGQMVPMTAVLAAGDGSAATPVKLQVPIFAPDLPRYATLTPGGAETSATSSPTASETTATATESPTATGTATATSTATATGTATTTSTATATASATE